ncbi:T9SS type A sorting domain-containing protein [candidate division KSB1 bacterium]|nr:T9SS type A sorting domain-containing protein [candidate division KSB1 bacterium]
MKEAKMSNKATLVLVFCLFLAGSVFAQSQADGPWMTTLGDDGVQIWVDLGYNQDICASNDSITFITDPTAGVTGKGAIQFSGKSGASDRRDWWVEYGMELPQEAMSLLSGEKTVYVYARTIDVGGGSSFNSVWGVFLNDTTGLEDFGWPQADTGDLLPGDPTTPNHRIGNENSKSPYFAQYEWLWTGYKEGVGDPPWSYPCFYTGLDQIPGEDNVLKFRIYERESGDVSMMLDAVVISDDSTWLRSLTDEGGFLQQEPIFNAYELAMANGTPLKTVSEPVVEGDGPLYTKFDPAGYGQVWIDAANYQAINEEEADSITVIDDPTAGVTGKGAVQFTGKSGASDPEDWWVEYDFELPADWMDLMDGSTVFYMYGRVIDIGGGAGANSVYVVLQNDTTGGKNFEYPMPDATGKLLGPPSSNNHRLGNEHSRSAYFQQFEWLWTGYKEGFFDPPWSYPCFYDGLWALPDGEDNVMRVRLYERESGPDAFIIDGFILTPDSTWLRSLTDEAGFLPPATMDSVHALAMEQGTALPLASEYIKTSVELYSEPSMPENYTLNQNYPNPFNPSTTISFSIPKNEYVKVSVYNLLGGLVAELYEGELSAGQHSVTWDGRDRSGNLASSGIYFYQLKAGSVSLTNKMIFTK